MSNVRQEREREKGIYILCSHAGPMQDARRLKPKRPSKRNFPRLFSMWLAGFAGAPCNQSARIVNGWVRRFRKSGHAQAAINRGFLFVQLQWILDINVGYQLLSCCKATHDWISETACRAGNEGMLCSKPSVPLVLWLTEHLQHGSTTSRVHRVKG